MTDTYRSLDEKPFEAHYLFEDIVIDAPPEHIWPLALRIGSWMDAHRLETIDGHEGEVGHFERVYPRGLGDETPLPHYHVYGVGFLVPNKYIGLEVMSERGGSYGAEREYISFDGITLADRGDGTTNVSFLMADAQLGSRAESVDERGALIEGAHAQIRGNLETLKALAEAN